MSAIVLLAVGPPALEAQAITQWTVRIYDQGAAAPRTTTALPAAAVQCNQAPPAPGLPTANPTRIVFDDPAITGRACIWTDPGNGPLAILPPGAATYEGTLTATNSAGTSNETARVSFTKPGVAPATPSGLRFVP